MLPAFCALLAVPVKLAVIVPAEKSPELSLATIAEAVFALVAVVAEFDTLPEVEMVLSLESAILPASIVLVTLPAPIATTPALSIEISPDIVTAVATLEPLPK